jgi:pimeloyl-ACP methyl ester carboxylesterase
MGGGPEMRVAESGGASASPVLLLHGWGASIYMWRDWFAPLAAAGRRVVAVDLPGHGLSDKPDDPESYRLPALVDTIGRFVDQEGLRGADLVAQSMAGTIGIELALAEEPKVGRVVLVNPARFGRIRLQALGRAISPPLVNHVLPLFVTRGVVARAHRMVFGDPSRISERDEDEYWAPSQFPAYARAMRRLLHDFDWTRPPADLMAERLRDARSEMLVVLGTRDRLVRDSAPYVDVLRRAGAPLVAAQVEGGGHAVNEECPEEVIALTMAHLDRTPSAAGHHRDR